MYKVYCTPSPFVFKPINDLLSQIGWAPEDLDDYLTLYLLNPADKKYKAYREDSHMTDAQSREDQLRYLGDSEVDRKLLFLANQIVTILDGQKIQFIIQPNYNLHNRFLIFIKFLNLYSNNIAEIAFENKYVKKPVLSALEELYFSSPEKKKANAEKY